MNIYLLPISSGFFETIKGSSRIIKGVLTEQDILSAPMSAPSPALERVVGGKMHTTMPVHSGGAHGGAHGGRAGGAMGGRAGGAHGGRAGGAHGGRAGGAMGEYM